jgi:hypothetical protein
MATHYTSSLASGNLTDVQYYTVGNRRCFQAKYSAPDAATAYVDIGIPTFSYAKMDSADDASTHHSSLGSAGAFLRVYFSGHAAGDTGYIFILS